mmetsp:Transcript_30472/g.49285  ORF Transcript_30472/g.49285 Transcript_30472/m.49285 type:complete len:81 (-) Transcript_30472:149-391(-)
MSRMSSPKVLALGLMAPAYSNFIHIVDELAGPCRFIPASNMYINFFVSLMCKHRTNTAILSFVFVLQENLCKRGNADSLD